jgi:hypothetical protein
MVQKDGNIMEKPIAKLLTFLGIKFTMCFHYHLGFFKLILPFLGICKLKDS